MFLSMQEANKLARRPAGVPRYAVEKIGFAEGAVIAGGNAQVAVYAESDGVWSSVGAAWPSSLSGAWTVLPGRGVVVGGKVPRGPYPVRVPGP